MSAAFASTGVGLEAGPLLALRHVAARMPVPPLPPNGLPGGTVSRRRGRGLEAADIRAFVPGDDPRLIDRNVTARTGTLHVRNVHDERDRTALLMVDFRPSMLWGTRRALCSVAAAEALALVGWRVVAAGGRVALLAFGAGEPVIVPARGRDRGMVAVIGGMVRAHDAATADAGAGEPPLADALGLARRMMPRGASVWLASALDGAADMDEEALRGLDARCPLTVLRIRDAFETSAPGGAYPFRLASGAGGVGRASGYAGEVVVARLRGWGIGAVTVDAADPPEAVAGGLHVGG